MPIPDYQTLMLLVLRLAADGETSQSRCVEKLADEFQLSATERAEMLPAGRQGVFYNRIHWARTYMKKAGLIETTRRGHFKITDSGKQILPAHPDRVDNTVLAQFLAAAGVGENIASHLGKFDGTIEFPIGKQSSVRCDLRSVKLQLQATIKIQPQNPIF
jgi:restriction endonuclease Mrr